MADWVWELSRAFLGASAGSALVTAGFALWQEGRRKREAGTYMAVRLAVVLEAFARDCSDLIEHNNSAEHHVRAERPDWKTRLPAAPDYPADADGWKALAPRAAADALQLQNRLVESQLMINSTIDYAEDQVGYVVEEEAADRGLEAWTLALELRRKHALGSIEPRYDYPGTLRSSQAAAKDRADRRLAVNEKIRREAAQGVEAMEARGPLGPYGEVLKAIAEAPITPEPRTGRRPRSGA